MLTVLLVLQVIILVHCRDNRKREGLDFLNCVLARDSSLSSNLSLLEGKILQGDQAIQGRLPPSTWLVGLRRTDACST
jgi:hypothetical protein